MSCQFCEIFKNTFFVERLRTVASKFLTKFRINKERMNKEIFMEDIPLLRILRNAILQYSDTFIKGSLLTRLYHFIYFNLCCRHRIQHNFSVILLQRTWKIQYTNLLQRE